MFTGPVATAGADWTVGLVGATGTSTYMTGKSKAQCSACSCKCTSGSRLGLQTFRNLQPLVTQSNKAASQIVQCQSHTFLPSCTAEVEAWSHLLRRDGRDCRGWPHSRRRCCRGRCSQGAGRSGRKAAVGGAQGGLWHYRGTVGRATWARGDGRDLLRVHTHGRVYGRHCQSAARRVRAAAQLHARGIVTRCERGDGVPAMQGASLDVRLA